MHNNLFEFGHSTSEVRSGIEKHYKRDHRVILALDALLFGSILFLLRDWPTSDMIATITAVFAGISGLRYFVDQSARNFFLHRLDWENATKIEDWRNRP